MKKFAMSLLAGTVALGHVACTAAAGGADTAAFVKARGGRVAEIKHLAASPYADIAPVAFYDKGNSVPSCGLVTAAASGKPGFIELVGSDPGVNFPQCLGIVSMTPFKLRGKDYLAVETLSRETREDVQRTWDYVVRDPAQGYVADTALAGAVPVAEASAAQAVPDAARAAQGVRLARAAALKQAFPQWRYQERDAIADKGSAFAVFVDGAAQACHAVAAAGAAPVAVSQADLVPGSRCSAVLASSRLERAGAVYYLAMFRLDTGKRHVAVASVGVDGKVAFEAALSARISRGGNAADIKSAKAALADALR